MPVQPTTIPPQLRLLVRVNLLQAVRKLFALREQSKLLSGLIFLFVGGYIALAFWLFQKGLKFAGTFPGLGGLLVERLMFLLFAILFVLLLFSNIIIAYTNLFRNRETVFLLTLPIESQTIFRWKFIESTLLASWAFLFLIAPLLAAYGMTNHVKWHFYPLTVVLTALFIVLPAVAGAWTATNIARFLDRKAFQIIAVVGSVILLIVSAFLLKPQPISDEMLETRVLAVLDLMLAKTRFAQMPFLPSYWLSSSVLQWAEGAVASALFFALTLLSYVLFFGYLAFTKMGGVFYEAISIVHSRASMFARWKWFQVRTARRAQTRLAPEKLDLLLLKMRWLRPEVRAIISKDLRVFWRDTTQWGQTLMLFGLLGAYIINLRHFSQQLTNPFWINVVSFLNLGACSLNLATLTTRFVFPQFSLEGKRVWIVGMAPIGLVKVVRIKFLLSSIGSLLVTVNLIALSCHMLRLPWDRTLLLTGAITIMTISLNGLAIGLGVLYPNFKEDNPGKIVSGFGGTFCLVLSFLYIVASVVLLALGAPWSRWIQSPSGSLALQVGSLAAFAGTSLLVGWLPLKLGLRKVASFEQT